MNALVDILACPFCKLGMDEIQARAMEYSIYFLLVLIYTLIAIIVFKIYRMMAREERDLALAQPVAQSARSEDPQKPRQSLS
jgi:hypothetical protein